MPDPIQTWFFSALVVRDGGRFVLVNETEGTWGLPGGRLEPGETFVDAAHREAREEAGIDVVLQGILDIEHMPLRGGAARMGVSFLARREGDARLKDVPDAESLGADWFEIEDLARLRLRNARVERLVRAAFSDAPLISLDRLVKSPSS